MEQPICCIAGYNTHEDIARAQEGGTAVVVYDHMATIYMHTGTGQTGLGQWCWFSVESKHGNTTRLVSAYQPCRTTNKSHTSVYLQYRRYFQQRGDNRCPPLIFRIDLEKEIEGWLSKGDRFIVFLDTNENLEKSPL